LQKRARSPRKKFQFIMGQKWKIGEKPAGENDIPKGGRKA